MCVSLGRRTAYSVNEKFGYKRIWEEYEPQASLQEKLSPKNIGIALGFVLGHFLFKETTFNHLSTFGVMGMSQGRERRWWRVQRGLEDCFQRVDRYAWPLNNSVSPVRKTSRSVRLLTIRSAEILRRKEIWVIDSSFKKENCNIQANGTYCRCALRLLIKINFLIVKIIQAHCLVVLSVC